MVGLRFARPALTDALCGCWLGLLYLLGWGRLGLRRRKRLNSSPARSACPGLLLKLSPQGEIVGAALGSKAVECRLGGRTALADCDRTGQVAATKLSDGGVEFRGLLAHRPTKAPCMLVERFRPTADSIRWEIEITAEGPQWSTAVSTQLRYPAAPQSRFWTAWSDPEHRDDGWRDPLALMPFADRSWSYQGKQASGSNVVIPLATAAEPDADVGLSLVLSPEDTLLDLQLTTREDGRIEFARTRHRLGEGKTVHFAMDLVPHEADWRGGLRWMVGRYPRSFNPPNPAADRMAGCGAYSADERPIDVAKFRRMAFRINWKCSEDFPYMGMFLPPLEDENARWKRQPEKPLIPGKSPFNSFKSLNDYCRRMQADGFFALSYFNATEFGAKMRYPQPPRRTATEADLWKDSNDYFYAKFPEALVLHKGRPLNTCYGAFVVDCGAPRYRQFLLEQARRHLERLPDSAGICIDRLDWLSRYNLRADDGASWVDSRPARSLFLSWRELMAQLGPLMHDAGKVIFVNNLRLRLELLRQVDGIYCEYPNGPTLNGNALLGIRKPTLIWTPNESWLEPDPDAYFQRHLHLGVFPTAPYPGNHHCITPSPFADRQYLDYGPLLDLLRGRKWVLRPHVVEAAGGAAKVNLFETPAGYVLPVTFAGRAASVRVALRGLPNLTPDTICEVRHPGGDKWVPLALTVKDGVASLDVPIARRAVRLRAKGK